MRESRTFGSVGGEGGNVLAYPAYTGRDANVVAMAARDSGCVKTPHGKSAPRILRRTVARKAEKCGNSCSARRYDQIRLSFHTAWTHKRHAPWARDIGHTELKRDGSDDVFTPIRCQRRIRICDRCRRP